MNKFAHMHTHMTGTQWMVCFANIFAANYGCVGYGTKH